MPNETFAAGKGLGCLVLALVIGSACGNVHAPPPILADPPSSPASIPIVIENVSVITMTNDAVANGRTVVIADGRVSAIGDASTPHPMGALVIDGRGRYLLPALIDMHVHVRTAEVSAYIRAGIATVRNMWGWPGLQALSVRINSGEIAGPRIISASPGLDDEPVQWPGTRVVHSTGDVPNAVGEQAQAGWRYVKVYTRLSRATYQAIMAEARRLDIPVVGHVPLAVPIEEAITLGQRSIEHLTGYETRVSRSGGAGTWSWANTDSTLYAGLAQLSAESNVWNCPTLAIYVALARQHTEGQRRTIIAQRRAFVRELHRAGARLLAGSDAGIDVVPAGTSLHDELAELAAAGLTPYQALRAATIDAGAFLGAAGLGTIVAGAPADLLLVERNPLADLSALRGPDGLVLRGAWLNRETLGQVR